MPSRQDCRRFIYRVSFKGLDRFSGFPVLITQNIFEKSRFFSFDLHRNTDKLFRRWPGDLMIPALIAGFFVRKQQEI
jgi:hypothetical protein